jgi:integrase
MVVVAQMPGTSRSEITGLQWGDLETERRQLLVQRSIVNGRVDDVKTEYSHDHVPIHESLLEVPLAWSEQCPQTEEGWMFPNPLSSKPYYFNRDPEAVSQACGHQVGFRYDRLAHLPSHVPVLA